MAERLEDVAVFIRAADNGSLSQAARQLDLTPAVASVALKRLESELGTRLLTRSTRNLRLTPDGERYLQHARDLLTASEAGRNAIAEGRQTVGGNVSVSMPSDLGRNLLFKWFDEFQELYPRVVMSIRLGDRLTDMFRQPVDLAVRYGQPDDSSLISLPLSPENRRVICASPSYFARHGWPQTPQDLVDHNCLRFALGDSIHQQWTFTHAAGGEAVIVRVSGNRMSDDAELVHRWAIEGKGIAFKSHLDVIGSLRAGSLVAALPNYLGELAPLQLMTTHRMLISPTVTALREFLQSRLSSYLAFGPNQK